MTGRASELLIELFGKYYDNRNRFARGEPWDRDLDVAEITTQAVHEGFEIKVSAGTFWLIRPSLLGNHVYLINEQNYRDGGQRNIRRHGPLRDACTAIRTLFHGEYE